MLVALLAEGETEIRDIYHIERGYSNFIEKLRSLGANIRKESITVNTVERVEKI